MMLTGIGMKGYKFLMTDVVTQFAYEVVKTMRTVLQLSRTLHVTCIPIFGLIPYYCIF